MAATNTVKNLCNSISLATGWQDADMQDAFKGLYLIAIKDTVAGTYNAKQAEVAKVFVTLGIDYGSSDYINIGKVVLDFNDLTSDVLALNVRTAFAQLLGVPQKFHFNVTGLEMNDGTRYNSNSRINNAVVTSGIALKVVVVD